MEDRFSNAFASGIPNPKLSAPTVKIDLNPSIEPIKIGLTPDMFDAINQQLAVLASLGAGKIVTKIQSLMPNDSTSLLPLDPSYMRAIKQPDIQATITQIAFNRTFGNDFPSRFFMVKAFLVLAYGESRLKKSAVNGVHTDVLQFSPDARKASAPMGAELIKHSRVLTMTLAYFQTLYKTELNRGEVMANVGRMFILANRVSEQWIWTNEGWQPKSAIAQSGRTQWLIKHYPQMLKSKDMGRVMLMTVYHINGLASLLGAGTLPLEHTNRLYEDPIQYYKLSRVPGLSKAIFLDLPGTLGGLFKEIGDGPEDEWEDNSAIHINKWWKAIIPFRFHEFPKGDGVKTSDYGMRKKIWDKSTKTWISAHFHHGQDYGAVTGQPVFALFDGEVSLVRDNGDKSYGLEVIIFNRVLNLKQRVGHLSTALVEQTAPPTSVKAGDIIGLAGESGLADAPHLHLEVISAKTGKQLPPVQWPVKGADAVNKRNT